MAKFNLADTQLTRGFGKFSIVNAMLESVRLIVNAPIYHKGRIDSSIQEPVQKSDSKNPGNRLLVSGLAQSYAS